MDGQDNSDRRRGNRVIVHGTVAEITIPDKCEGLKIVRLERKGVGMEYLDVPYSTCELLRTLMLYKAKDPVETAKLFSDFCSKIREQKGKCSGAPYLRTVATARIEGL